MSFICHIHNYTEYNQQWNVCSAFNPSKCTHTWSSGQPTLRFPGSSRGFSALLKGLTSVVDNYCRRRDSNPQPRVTSPMLYPLEPRPPREGNQLCLTPLFFLDGTECVCVSVYVCVCVCVCVCVPFPAFVSTSFPSEFQVHLMTVVQEDFQKAFSSHRKNKIKINLLPNEGHT